MRTGSTIMDNVEIFNCSQIDTEKAAIRFESATSMYHSITNSVLHNGYSWGLLVKSSANVHIDNNILFQFRPIGLSISNSNNVTIDNNVVAGIVERSTIEPDLHSVDKGGGFSICSYYGGEVCNGIRVRNNLAAGIVYAGFVMQGHDCGDYTTQYGNVAHSVHGLKAGHGAYIKHHPSQTTCMEFSDFAGYKCFYNGAFMYPEEMQGRMTRITAIDNIEGFGAMVKKKTTEYNIKEDGDLIFSDIHVFSETDSPDCPQGGDGGFCYKYHKMAFMTSQGTWGGKAAHIDTASPLPPHNIMSIATWATTIKLYRVTFYGLKAKTKLGMDNMAFQMNKWSSDNIPIQEFYDTKFIDCDEDALAYFREPPKKWAIIKDCGAWPCTAPKNTFFSFKNTKWVGKIPSYAASDFTMIPDTKDFSEYVPNCIKQPKMNLWICQQEKLGILQFESEDSDTLDRSMQPIYSQLQGTGMNNKINSYMDHVWDGFYTGQTRLSRFPIIVYAPTDAEYDIVYTGTPAKKQKYTLFSQDNTLSMVIRIAYPGAESRQILKDGKRVDMNQWDESISTYGEIKREFCGENRFIGVKNILEFYLTKGCVLQIAPRDAIQTMVRMEWTQKEFFSNGGTTAFVDRVAGSLGIHASTIKVVSVYEGSLVVNYDIVVDDADAASGNAANVLAEIQQKQTDAFASGAVDLGAPILDVQASVVDASVDSVTAETTLSGGADASKIQSIISGGQVKARGYKPLVLYEQVKIDNTKSEVLSGEAQQENNFNPTINTVKETKTTTIVDNKVVDVVNRRKEVRKWDKPDHEDLDLSQYEVEKYDLSDIDLSNIDAELDDLYENQDDILIETPSVNVELVDDNVESLSPDVAELQEADYQMDGETVMVQQGDIKISDVVNVEDRKIVVIENTDSTAVLIIIIASAAVILIIIGCIIRYFYNKLRIEKARAEQIKNTQKNLNAQRISVKPMKGDFNSSMKKINDLPEDSADKNEELGEIFEEQYDPNNEFRIFGVGDKTKGGVQSLQEKMNMADDVDSARSSETEKEEAAPTVAPQVADIAELASSQQNPLSNNSVQPFNPQSLEQNNSLDESIRSSSSHSSKRLLMAEEPTPMGSLYREKKKNSNQLAEDQEIIDEEEEEEEEDV